MVGFYFLIRIFDWNLIRKIVLIKHLSSKVTGIQGARDFVMRFYLMRVIAQPEQRLPLLP